MLRLVALLLLAGLAAAPACAEGEPGEPGAAGDAEVLWVPLGGETFTLELAADPATRQRGLSGRTEIPRHGGMLFVFARSRPQAMVMRDCSVPIDVAFLDATGRVVSVHAMRVEPPRRPGETRAAYEARLPLYGSRVPARFAIEVAGGRLAELGVSPGASVALDAEALVARAR